MTSPWLLAGVLAGALGLAGAAAPKRAAVPALDELRVTNGSTPFRGDSRLLTTVSPNGDGFRDRVVVSFRLSRDALVRLDVLRTDTIRVGRAAAETIWSSAKGLRAGPNQLVWRPARSTPPRTYVLRLTVGDGTRHRVYGRPAPNEHSSSAGPVVRVQGIDAGFPLASYAPGQRATLSLATDAASLQLQVFAYSTTLRRGDQDFKTSGLAMTPPLSVDWRAHRDAPAPLRLVRAGNWPSGLYFLRARAADGRVGYAPFIVRSRRPSLHRVAVVLSTNTWQAYNFRDSNGDGWGDSWYVSERTGTIDLRRPYQDFGLPFRFKDWDLTFIAWLNRTGKAVDYLSDDDLERFGSARQLAGAYDLVVFPGHEEYVTQRAYDLVQRYRNLGGNLMFLSANNFFWKVRREKSRLRRVREWRRLGRPESALVGAQYVGSNHGAHQEPYRIVGVTRTPWAFAGTNLAEGDALGGKYGIEIDARTSASPPGTSVLARIPDLMGPGRTAEMTYYETPSGAKVFAAGTINFAATIDRPNVSQLVENVWARLSKP